MKPFTTAGVFLFRVLFSEPEDCLVCADDSKAITVGKWNKVAEVIDDKSIKIGSSFQADGRNSSLIQQGAGCV